MTPLTLSLPTQRLADDLADLGPEVEIVLWNMDAAPPRENIDVVVAPYLAPGAPLAWLSEVQTRLVQAQAIGYEGIEQSLPSGIRFANAASVHEASTAELAVTLALAAQREIAPFVHAQDEGRWTQRFTASLADRRVLLLGYGGVGKAVAARLAPFEVDVVPVASRARDEDGVAVHGIDELPELLPTAEIVILTLPANEHTKHLVNEEFLATLPDNALIVNVGRGPLVDTEALLATNGRIRAALDVTDPEPLPQDHPLWKAPGVLISPHVGGASTAMHPRMVALIRRQVERMLAGEEPVNVVIET